MESNNKLKEISIKNRTSNYFDDIIKFKYFDINNILIDEKSYENIMIYYISYKTLMVAKPLHIRLVKVNGFIGIYDGTEYLVLFGPDKHDTIFNRIIYLIGVKISISYVISHYYTKIKVDSDDSLLLGKKLNAKMLKCLILIKPVFNKDKNNYYYNTFLEKGSCKLP